MTYFEEAQWVLTALSPVKDLGGSTPSFHDKHSHVIASPAFT